MKIGVVMAALLLMLSLVSGARGAEPEVSKQALQVVIPFNELVAKRMKAPELDQCRSTPAGVQVAEIEKSNCHNAYVNDAEDILRDVIAPSCVDKKNRNAMGDLERGQVANFLSCPPPDHDSDLCKSANAPASCSYEFYAALFAGLSVRDPEFAYAMYHQNLSGYGKMAKALLASLREKRSDAFDWDKVGRFITDAKPQNERSRATDEFRNVVRRAYIDALHAAAKEKDPNARAQAFFKTLPNGLMAMAETRTKSDKSLSKEIERVGKDPRIDWARFVPPPVNWDKVQLKALRSERFVSPGGISSAGGQIDIRPVSYTGKEVSGITGDDCFGDPSCG